VPDNGHVKPKHVLQSEVTLSCECRLCYFPLNNSCSLQFTFFDV